MKKSLSIPLAFLGLLCTSIPSSAQGWSPAAGHVMTRWAREVTPYNPLPDYPRPQMVRKDWQSLNGLWDYALTDHSAGSPPDAYEGNIAVPFPYESALSGLGRPSIPDQRLWCHRKFTIPAAWKGQRVLVHFGAVNWDSSVSVNGQPLGTHRGGYESFSFDMTDVLKPGSPNELVVSAWNPLYENGSDGQVMGKQRLHPGGYYFTAATGIWQSVWMEPVPTAASVGGLKLTPDLDDHSLHVIVESGAAGGTVKVVATDGGKPVATVEGDCNADLRVPILKVHPWTPDDPHLYDLAVTLVQGGKPVDKVTSYFGMRKIALGPDEQGHMRVMLNDKFVFQRGVLDHGYWPDGIYTAPTDEALRSDLEAAKRLGFNLDRKHGKVEPERWYYHADKLGLLVWQDMPQMYERDGQDLSDTSKRQFESELNEIIGQLRNHPSIIVWTMFSEGRGQYDPAQVVALARQYDHTRLIDGTSGGPDKGVGDFRDSHAYPGPFCEPPEGGRAVVNGECGGFNLLTDGHLWDPSFQGRRGFVRSPWALNGNYQDLLRAAYDLKNQKAMSAVVYTQLTDVETESSGLLTCDRAVVKVDADIVSAANQGNFPALPPNPDPLPTSQDAPATWQYTTGSPPGGWEQPAFDDVKWNSGPGGFGRWTKGCPIGTEWKSEDIWLRRRVTLPAKLPIKLEFMTFHDDDVEIYVNGVLAATAKGYITEYTPLPMSPAARAAIKPGLPNVIAVHCHQKDGPQFIDVGIVSGN